MTDGNKRNKKEQNGPFVIPNRRHQAETRRNDKMYTRKCRTEKSTKAFPFRSCWQIDILPNGQLPVCYSILGGSGTLLANSDCGKLVAFASLQHFSLTFAQMQSVHGNFARFSRCASDGRSLRVFLSLLRALHSLFSHYKRIARARSVRSSESICFRRENAQDKSK